MTIPRFHRERRVRLHATGQWVCTIGKVVTKSGKLSDKVWYWSPTLTEEAATEKANEKANDWERLCKTWATAHQPFLAILGEPFADQPHWQGAEQKAARGKIKPDELAAIRREGRVEHEELAEAYAEFTFVELIPEYIADRRSDLKSEETQNSSLAKLRSQLNSVAEYLPSDIPAVRLTAEHFRQAKDAMLAKHKKRTARNYLSAAVTLVRWLYGRFGGNDARLLIGIEDAITIRGTTKTKIKVYGVKELKELVRLTKGTICQLDLLLALNCGMYEADIGRLLLEEIGLEEGSVFWDREKEANDITMILTELQKRIQAKLNDPEITQMTFEGWSDPERDQLERNMDALRRRVREIPEEIERETAAVKARFANPQPRMFPVAVTFIVPDKLSRG